MSILSPITIREGVAVMDPANSTNAVPNTLVVNSDGSINVKSSASGTFESSANASAAAPSYSAGVNPLSQDLSGNLRVVTGALKSTTMTATQVTVPATTNGILILAANANRLGATISNPGAATVYIQQAATGVTTSNGFGIPGGSSYNIDTLPLYTGAIYGIIAASTQVVTVVELT